MSRHAPRAFDRVGARAGRGPLPLEARSYVLAITGRAVQDRAPAEIRLREAAAGLPALQKETSRRAKAYRPGNRERELLRSLTVKSAPRSALSLQFAQGGYGAAILAADIDSRHDAAPRHRECKKLLSRESTVSVIARTVVRGLASAPRLVTRIGLVLNRSVASRYEEQRARIERTGSGGLI